MTFANHLIERPNGVLQNEYANRVTFKIQNKNDVLMVQRKIGVTFPFKRVALI